MALDPVPPATPPAARLRARTRRQAMDWSLVLASQGIEHGLEHTEATGWALVVAATEAERARAVIRQYQRENPRWPWRRTVFQPDVLFDGASAAWVLLTLVFYWLETARAGVRAWGVMDGAAVGRGEWWRLFTATLLHADLAHLATNAAFGFVLLGLAMGRFGTGAGLLAAYLAGGAGNVAAWLVYGDAHRGLGASGVVMGALGLLTVPSAALLRNHPRAWKLAMSGAAGGGLLFVLLALNPEADVVAHLGGFVAGSLFGAGLALVFRLPQRRWVHLAAGLIFTMLVILTWLLALTRGAARLPR
jgi:rhomboid protease GluP